MPRWIVRTWNGEIPPTIELPPVFSVEIAVAGAKKGCFWMGCSVLSAKEWWYGVPMLIEVRGDLFVSVCTLGLTRFKPWAGKIWG